MRMHAKMVHTSVGPIACLLLAALGQATGATMSALKNQSPNQGPAAQLHQQQQPSQSAGLAMQQQHGPAMAHAQHQQPPQQHQQQAQYVHEKEPALQELHINGADDDLGNINDPYQILSEFTKPEARLPATPPHAYSPWNPFAIPLPSTTVQHQQQQQMTNSPPPPPVFPPFMYSAFDRYPAMSSPLSSMHTPKFLPIFGYPQVFIPVPLYMGSEMFYPTFSAPMDQPVAANDLDDMARAAHGGGRRSSTQPRNSPIYYVRLPPTPYMYLPGLASSSPQANYGSLMSLPSFPAISPVFNLPVNFLANGKPAGIYQMTDLPNPMQFNNGFTSFSAPRPNPYRPPMMANYGHGGSFATSSYAQQPQQQDTKMTTVKRPFFFNGRPEDIYVLPNNFNSMYPETGYY